MMFSTFIFTILFGIHPEVIEAKKEFTQYISNEITCNITITRRTPHQTYTNVKDKKIIINKKYWYRLDKTARKVIVLRELLHCEKGYPYMVGISIMNKKITQAVNAYIYGV